MSIGSNSRAESRVGEVRYNDGHPCISKALALELVQKANLVFGHVDRDGGKAPLKPLKWRSHKAIRTKNASDVTRKAFPSYCIRHSQSYLHEGK